MRVLFVLTALVLSAATAVAQSVQFALIDPAVVRDRLISPPRDTRQRFSLLQQLFGYSGCLKEDLRLQSVRGSRTPNVICSINGESANAILVTANYDMVGPGDGVIDNWSGASMLANLYAALNQAPRRHTIRFVGFTDQHKGLAGSTFYLSTTPKVDLAKIKAVVNVETIGTGPVSVWSKRSDPRLLFALRQIETAMKLEISWIELDRVFDDDSRPFVLRKIPVIDFHSLTQATLGIPHSSKDTFAAVQMDEYLQTYRTLAAFVAWMDLQLEEILARQVQLERRR